MELRLGSAREALRCSPPQTGPTWPSSLQRAGAWILGSEAPTPPHLVPWICGCASCCVPLPSGGKIWKRHHCTAT